MARPRKEQPKHSSGMYEYKATVGHTFDGKPIRKSFYSNTSKAAAKAKAEEYIINSKVAEQTGEAFCPNEISFKRCAEQFLKLKEGKVKNNTFHFTYYVPINNYLLPHFGKAKISDIRQSNIEEYFKGLADELCKETLRKHLICLNAIFEQAVADEYITRNPCARVVLPKKCKPSKSKSVYTPEQARLLLDYCYKHEYGIDIHLLLGYGLSRSELLGIKKRDYDYDSNILNINRGVTECKNPVTGKTEIIVDEPKNDFRKRAVPLLPETVKFLEPILAEMDDDDFLISSKKSPKKPYFPSNWSERRYKRFMADMHDYYIHMDSPVDVPVLNPHELRHTRASIWVNSGVNIFAIASVMGWAALKMLRKRYGHPDQEKIRQQLDI